MKNVPASSFLQVVAFLNGVRERDGMPAFQEALTQWIDNLRRAFSNQPGERDARLRAFLHGMLIHVFPEQNDWRMRQEYVIWARYQEADDDHKTGTLAQSVCDLFGREESPKLVERVKSHLKECSERQLAQMTVESLAETFGMSRNPFSRRFHSDAGYAAQEAIANAKLDRAFAMFSDPQDQKSVAQVARLLGYSGEDYFRSVFKTRFGLLPSDVKHDPYP